MRHVIERSAEEDGAVVPPPATVPPATPDGDVGTPRDLFPPPPSSTLCADYGSDDDVSTSRASIGPQPPPAEYNPELPPPLPPASLVLTP